MFGQNTTYCGLERLSRSSPNPRMYSLFRSVGMRQSLPLGSAMVVAGSLDCAVNVLAGRWLQPVALVRGTLLCREDFTLM